MQFSWKFRRLKKDIKNYNQVPYAKRLNRETHKPTKICVKNFFSRTVSQKEELSEPSHTPDRLRQKGRWAKAFSLFGSRIRLTFVGYPLHSYLP